MASFIHRELSDKVLGAAFAVHNALGPDLLESAYEGALCVELRHNGLGLERHEVFPL
jgi:GxxExxY protein